MNIIAILAVWFLIFMVYSAAGWLLEVLVTILQRRKLVNRGFLVGPICPIYGVGGVLLSLILSPTENWFAVFCVAIVGSALLEYFVSFIMEKLFRVRWWDYAERKFNLNGRICAESIIAFGLVGILMIKVTTPALLWLFWSLPPLVLYLLAGSLLVWLIADLILSLWLIFGVRVTVGTAQRDATEEIAEHVREVLMGKGKLNRRLVKAFPKQQPSKKKPRAKSAKAKHASKTSQ